MMSARSLLHELAPPFLWRALRGIAGARDEPRGTHTIDPDTNRIFVHIHKCAGTSVRQALISQPGFITCAARPGYFEHRIGRELIDDEIWERSFKFTFVRNPYARIVSAFKMFHKSPRWRELFADFEGFVDFLRWCDVDRHFVERPIPTHRFVESLDNVIQHCSSFHNPKYMLDQLDFIGRVETLSDDLQQIANRTQTAVIKVPKLNTTRPDDYRDYYSDRTRQIIGEKYAADIQRFSYEF